MIGQPLSIGRKKYSQGLGTHADSQITIKFEAQFKTFSGSCGVDDEEGTQTRGSVVCQIKSGEEVLFESPMLHGGDAAFPFSVSVQGLSELDLWTLNGGDGEAFDRVNWVDLHLK